MKNLISILPVIPIFIATVVLSGCSTPAPQSSPPPTTAPEPAAPPKVSPTALEGTWKGRDVTPGHEGSATLIFKGQTIDFHGADDDDWMKGTFTIREDAAPKQFIGVVTDCSSSDQIGKKAYAIYKIEDGTLTVTGSSLGDPEFPVAFDAPNAREFVLKREP